MGNTGMNEDVPVDGVIEDWSLEDVAAALRVAVDDFETFELAGADLLWGGSRDG